MSFLQPVMLLALPVIALPITVIRMVVYSLAFDNPGSGPVFCRIAQEKNLDCIAWHKFLQDICVVT